jgi:hypothetical protein
MAIPLSAAPGRYRDAMTEPDRPADPVPPVRPGSFLLELVLVPVSDIDRAKAFYSERAGFGVDVDVRPAPLR